MDNRHLEFDDSWWRSLCSGRDTPDPICPWKSWRGGETVSKKSNPNKDNESKPQEKDYGYTPPPSSSPKQGKREQAKNDPKEPQKRGYPPPRQPVSPTPSSPAEPPASPKKEDQK